VPLREVNGVRLMVDETGNGEPLVLVHGSWGDRQGWTLVLGELGRQFRVISYDRRGHSESEDSREPGTRRDDEDDLAALIEALGPAPVNVVANSFGASISLGLLARRPELFRTLCAHEPPLVGLALDDPAVSQLGAGVAGVLEQIDRGEVETAAEDFVENVALGPGAWAMLPDADRATMVRNAHTFAEEGHDPAWANLDLEALARTEVPILLTQGDQSPPVFPVVVSRLAEGIEAAEVQTLPGAGHLPHVTHPKELCAAIASFAGR
jgi:pimeloyl-ACP methyl ester carboxylesterase